MEFEKEYQEVLDYLYRFVDFSLTKSFLYSPENFDLGRMFAFMDHLGNPERSYPILHIAGTKGKGSVSTLCAAALQAAGYRVGLYTSPHLEDYNERIQVNRQPIPHHELISLVNEFRPYLDAGTQLTTFEITTALALTYFSRCGVNAAVLEVGLGGRLDATNICQPVASVITSISYDHTQVLGETLAKIAAEKAGIIKPGTPVVVAPQPEEARAVIAQIAVERGAPLVQVGRDYLFERQSGDLDEGQSLLIWPAAAPQPARLQIRLLGQHQVENAATAYTALCTATSRGLPVAESAIREGFAVADWPGRFEILRRDPPVVIDSAHNRDSALKLRQTVDEYYPDLPVVLVFGASEDKDIPGMLVELMPRIRQLVATRSLHPRAIPPAMLEELARPYDRPVITVEDVEDALEEALRLAGERALVLVTGSIFIAAGVRESWYKRVKSAAV